MKTYIKIGYLEYTLENDGVDYVVYECNCNCIADVHEFVYSMENEVRGEAKVVSYKAYSDSDCTKPTTFESECPKPVNNVDFCEFNSADPLPF